MLLIGDMSVFSVLVNQQVSLKMYYAFVMLFIFTKTMQLKYASITVKTVIFWMIKVGK